MTVAAAAAARSGEEPYLSIPRGKDPHHICIYRTCLPTSSSSFSPKNIGIKVSLSLFLNHERKGGKGGLPLSLPLLLLGSMMIDTSLSPLPSAYDHTSGLPSYFLPPQGLTAHILFPPRKKWKEVMGRCFFEGTFKILQNKVRLQKFIL